MIILLIDTSGFVFRQGYTELWFFIGEGSTRFVKASLVRVQYSNVEIMCKNVKILTRGARRIALCEGKKTSLVVHPSTSEQKPYDCMCAYVI